MYCGDWVSASGCLFSASSSVNVAFTQTKNLLWLSREHVALPSSFSVSAPDLREYSALTSRLLILTLTPSRSDKSRPLPLFPCLKSKRGNSRRTPLSAPTEDFHIIDYKWDNKSLHHFIGPGVKITCLHLHIVLQLIPLYTCRPVSPSSSPHMTYGSCIDGSLVAPA